MVMRKEEYDESVYIRQRKDDVQKRILLMQRKLDKMKSEISI